MPPFTDRPASSTAVAAPTPRGGAAGEHPVVFYEDDDRLCDTVARWMLATALERGDTVAVVATPAHRVGFAAVLRAVGVDVTAARASGRFVEVDAAELLASVWTDDGPDAIELTAIVGALDQAARDTGGRLHLFSEMVTLLWDRDLATVALELEALGTRLVDEFDLDMICAYPTRAFPDGPATPGHVEVCASHTAQFDATTPVTPGGTAAIGAGGGQVRRLVREPAPQRRHAWLRSVTDLMHEGLATLDGYGRIVSVNPHGEQLLAAPHGSAVGGSFVNRLLPVRADGTVADLSETLIGAEFDGQLPDQPTEARLLHADGTTVPIEYVATDIASEDGRPNGWVVVFRDISDRLERDRELRADADRARWMARIRHALDHDEFVLHAQPIVDLKTGRVVHHELLIRLQDPEAGLIGPGAFLPTAETYGLAPAIDRWVVAEAVDLAAAGHAVHVNLSARSFADPSLPHLVGQLLGDTDADPSLLVFELTETAMLDNAEEASRFAERIRALGCHLALDDFGTGFGAFVYLKHLPVDLLKIDIEFVRDALTNPASRHVIVAVVTLARSLGIQTVAEGVEDAATLDLLVELGVDQAQGYHLGRPAPLGEMAGNGSSPCT